ncbi:MAG: FAD-binding protein [Acidimicrobiia bacterium]
MLHRGLARAEPSSTLPASRELLSGWGGWPRSTAHVVRPADPLLLERLSISGRGVVARGLGRSYGDAAQLSGGTVIDMTALRGVEGFDPATGSVTALAGTSLGEILEQTVPRGWFLPVTPGTRHVTVGGAVAADVHGKNHHRDGSFGSYIEELRLVTPEGVVDVMPGDPAFPVTVGGMGLTGVIAKARFRLKPIETPWMQVDTLRGDDIETVMGLLHDMDLRRQYTVAWLDLTRAGRGRGIVLAADHTLSGDLPAHLQAKPLARRSMPTPVMPRLPGPGLVNAVTVGAFNRMWLARAPARELERLERLDSFFFPLDRVESWNRIYGNRGFLQYQFVVPPQEATVLVTVARIISAAAPVSLAVMKRMGRSSGGMLSFPTEGWTLSLDMPLGDSRLGRALDRCDRLVAEAGGRVYLAKDSRLLADAVRDMYPSLTGWREARARLDPMGELRSDLSDRLGLVA